MPLPRKLRDAEGHHAGRTARLPLHAADGQPRVPARAPHTGADAVELFSVVRSQPADVVSEHLLGEAGRLPEVGPSRVPRSRPGELCRVAGGEMRRAALRGARTQGMLPVIPDMRQETLGPAEP